MRKFFLIGLLIALVMASLAGMVHPAFAEGGSCEASPSEATVGTTFHLHASGFSPNTMLYAYAVDPNGTAFSDINFNAFGGSLKSNETGSVSFTFVTRFDVQDFAIARAFGTWRLVVQQLGPGGSVAHQATCTLTVMPNGADVPVGATMQAMPDTAPVGAEIIVYAKNFTPGELVNLWASPPPGCTSFGYGLPHVLLQYATASAYAQDTVRVNGAGEFAYTLPTDRTYSCPGDWALSAYAPGSKRGAIVYFKLTPQGVFEPGQPALVAQASSVAARGGSLGFYGMHFKPNSLVSCWLGRPDLTVRFVDNHYTNDAGAFWFTYHTGFDDVAHQVHYSEGTLGKYVMSCRDNLYGTEASATFTLIGDDESAGSSSSSSSSSSNAPSNPMMGPGMEP